MGNFNAKALALLKQLEGLRLQAYQDDAGVWTVGYGHTGKDVMPGTLWTIDYAEEALQRDLAVFVRGVGLLAHPMAELTDNQFSALVIFAYNEGLAALAGSTLLRHVNGGLDSYVPDDFMHWIYIHVNGAPTVSEGLVKRRQAEVQLWLSN